MLNSLKKYLLSGQVIFLVSRNWKHRPTRVTCSLAEIIIIVDDNCKYLILSPLRNKRMLFIYLLN